MARLAGAARQAERRERVSAFKRSGLTRAAWCAREGVALSTLAYWQRQSRMTLGSGSLVPIVVRDPVALPNQVLPGVVSIEVSGAVMRAGADVDTRWLAALLRALR